MYMTPTTMNVHKLIILKNKTTLFFKGLDGKLDLWVPENFRIHGGAASRFYSHYHMTRVRHESIKKDEFGQPKLQLERHPASTTWENQSWKVNC
jgi:hypothetical protein